MSQWFSQNSKKKPIIYLVVQLLSRVQLFVIPWPAACQASLSFTIARSLLKLMSIKSVMPSNHIILCCPLLLLLSILPSIRVFSNELPLHIRWPKYWSFRFSICPSNEYWELISFTIDWFDLLAVQGTLKSLFQQFKGISSSVLIFIVQLSHLYMAAGKTIYLTSWTFVSKVHWGRNTKLYTHWGWTFLKTEYWNKYGFIGSCKNIHVYLMYSSPSFPKYHL